MIATLLICSQLFAIDGDTVQCDGDRLRLLGPGRPGVSGMDTPESGTHADCPNEARLGELARSRLIAMLDTPSTKILHSGQFDRYGRGLVWVRLASGLTAGETLLNEGLAQPWPNDGNIWCS